MIRLIILSLGLVYLTGCSFFAVNTKINTFTLSARPGVICDRKIHAPRLILFTMPSAPEFYQTTQIAYSPLLYKLAYFGHNQWAATPAQMLHNLLLTLGNNGCCGYYALSESAGSLRYDYIVNTRILDIYEDTSQEIRCFKIKIRVEVIDAQSNRIVVIRNFAHVELVQYSTIYSALFAANRAIAAILADLDIFIQTQVVMRK